MNPEIETNWRIGFLEIFESECVLTCDFFFIQVLVDGPSTEEQKIVPRHVLPLAHATLTHFTIPQLPRAAGTGPVKKLWAKNEIDGKWAKSSFSQRTDRSERRKNLSDFERFKVLRLRKQVRWKYRKGDSFWHNAPGPTQSNNLGNYEQFN